MHRRTFCLSVAFASMGGAFGCSTAPTVPNGVRDALAPTGKLRFAALPGAPTSYIKEAGGVASRGVGFEVASELARRLGVPIEIAEYGSFAAKVDALTSGRADISAFNATSPRAAEVLLTPALYEIESGYLVGPRTQICVIDEIDRMGIRVGVQQGSSSQAALTRLLKNAKVVPIANLQTVPDLLVKGELEAFATNKPILFDTMDRTPGARVLDGRFGIERHAMGYPKGRDAAAPFMAALINDMAKRGMIDQAAARARLRGIIPASPA